MRIYESYTKTNKSINQNLFVDSHKFVGSHRSRGQVLLEAMISLTIITVSILGIFALLSNSLGQARVSANQVTAAHLAAEGIEVVKNILDKNYVDDDGGPWNENLENCTGGCSVQYNSTDDSGIWQGEFLEFNPVDKVYLYDDDEPETSFKRELIIKLNPDNTDEMRVVSTVTWRDRGGLDHEIVLEDRFFNWRD